MDIKLVAIDLDGTTFDNKGVISRENIEAIKRANSMGIYVVPTTGRAFYELPVAISSISELEYFVVSNGASVTNRDNRQIYKDEIPFDIARKIVEIIKKHNIMPELYLDGEPIAQKDKMNKECFEYFEIDKKYFDVLIEQRKGVDDIFEYFETKKMDVEKFNLFFKTKEERREFVKEIGVFGDFIEVTSSMESNLEINKKGANKGTGLVHLCQLLGIDSDQVMAIGDSDNDITMLRFAGTAVAVANACRSLKVVANNFTVSNDESAIAVALNEFVFKK